MSQDALCEGGLRSVALAPDMTHALWPTLRPSPPAAAPSGTLHMFRAHVEAGAMPAEIAHARGALLDWEGSVPRVHFAMFRAMRKLHLLAGSAGGGRSCRGSGTPSATG